MRQFLFFCSKAHIFHLLAIRRKGDTVHWLVEMKLMYHRFTNQTDEQGSSLCEGEQGDYLVPKENIILASLAFPCENNNNNHEVPPQKLLKIACLTT